MNEDLLEIDGSYGEGGGQILRTSMALAALRQRPIRIENIRANRKKPGLRPQHQCAVRAARQVCDGELIGDEVSSSRIEFYPGTIRGGEFDFDIGTAGSCTLVAQTILPTLLLCPENSIVRLTGGTHNPMAPPADFFESVYLSSLRKQMGLEIHSKLKRHGFYPRGGGKLEFSITPQDEWKVFSWHERGKLESIEIKAMVFNLPKHIADREIELVRKRGNFHQAKLQAVECHDPDLGPANFMVARLEFEYSSMCFVESGRQGVRAEQVAANLLRTIKSAMQSAAPVGEYLADQLLLPAALTADRIQQPCEFVTEVLSLHLTTHIWILEKFLDVSISTEKVGAGHLVRIEPTNV